MSTDQQTSNPNARNNKGDAPMSIDVNQVTAVRTEEHWYEIEPGTLQIGSFELKQGPTSYVLLGEICASFEPSDEQYAGDLIRVPLHAITGVRTYSSSVRTYSS